MPNFRFKFFIFKIGLLCPFLTLCILSSGWSAGSNQENIKIQAHDPVFVMFTDDNYVLPTIVTLSSFLKHITGHCRVVVFTRIKDSKRAGVMRKVIEKVVEFRRKEREDQKLPSSQGSLMGWSDSVGMTFSQEELQATVEIKPIKREGPVATEAIFASSYPESIRYKVSIHCALLKKSIPIVEDSALDDYMWLDSDMLIYADLSKPYNVCRECGVFLGAVNYWFFDPVESQNIDKFSGCVGLICIDNHVSGDTSDNGAKTRLDSMWRTSGGLVYVNTAKLPLDKVQFNDTSSTDPRFKDDETLLDSLAIQGRGRVLALNPIYNCKPEVWELACLCSTTSGSSIFKASHEQLFELFKEKYKQQSNYTLINGDKDIDLTAQYTASSILSLPHRPPVIHWDHVTTKPWQKEKSTKKADKLWYDERSVIKNICDETEWNILITPSEPLPQNAQTDQARGDNSLMELALGSLPP